MDDFNLKIAKCRLDIDTYNEVKKFVKNSKMRSVSEFVKVAVKLLLKNKDSLLK